MKGIYFIKDKQDRYYVGSSKDIEKRLKRHFNELAKGSHHNIFLQRIYNKHGLTYFESGIFEETEMLFEREKYYIDLYGNLNIGSVGGGDNLTRNPNRADIIRRMTETMKMKYKNGEIILNDRSKEKNGRWKGGEYGPNWKKCPGCDVQIYITKETCGDCRPRTGIDNPFYGKTHSIETRKKISDSRIGKLPSNTKKVKANGVIYESGADCARSLGISCALVTYRVKSSKYDYEYLNA